MYQNRSAASGTSAPAATVFALPLSSDSSSASSSVFSAIRSPSRCRRRPRSDGVSRLQGPSSAARAALTARSTSAALPWATCASTSPVPGSKLSNVSPSSASTHLPLISSLRGCAVNCRVASATGTDNAIRLLPLSEYGVLIVSAGTLHPRCKPTASSASPGPFGDRADRVQLVVRRRPAILLAPVPAKPHL